MAKKSDIKRGNAPANRLREARLAVGLKRVDDGWSAVKKYIDVSKSAYRHHDNGTRNFDAEQATAYAAAFGTTPEWLTFATKLQNRDHNDAGSANDFTNNLVKHVVIKCAAKREANAGEANLGEFVISRLTPLGADVKDIELFGINIDDDHAKNAYPEGVRVVVARPDGPNGMLPTGNNNVALKTTEADIIDRITIRLLKVVDGLAQFHSLGAPDNIVPEVYMPGPNDTWEVLGQVVAWGRWETLNPGLSIPRIRSA